MVNVFRLKNFMLGHMINMGKHASHENPPDLPYFGKQKQNIPNEKPTPSKVKCLPAEEPDVIALSPATLSPGKRIQYRSQCMEQLSKWHSLLESGVVSQQQYSILQASILDDITKL